MVGAANLRWAIENEIVTTRGINAHLPPVDEWPAALLDLLPPDAPRNNWRRTLLCVLARMLYPSTLDLHGFRVLLMAATGHTSEEVLRGDPRSKHRRRAMKYSISSWPPSTISIRMLCR